MPKKKSSITLKAYTQTIKQLKSAILVSRYRAAVLANRELIVLYFNVGKLLDERIRLGRWGDKILQQLSADLQYELPGLKGFSATNIKNMRAFFVYWSSVFSIGQSPTDQLKKGSKKNPLPDSFVIGQSPTDQLADNFYKVSFTHHIALLVATKSIQESIFYLNRVATEFWTVATLKHHIKNKLFKKGGTLPNNFAATISNDDLRFKALQSFKDEYLLDYINIEDPGEADERIIENEIVRNIKKFLMSLGTDFAFIANQYRVIVDDQEYFTDLLFFNRKLQCLVAFDLKKGKFKPEYVGKMNFYLSALDEYNKQPNEQPSIGIILCKEKSNKTVEFAFRDMGKPMGVSTFKTSSQLPKQFKDALPDVKTLKQLMG
jgi:predicted nuclease of restriction endonuclease-like (RecB) superfamily